MKNLASVAGHCSRENPLYLTYVASGIVAVCLNTDTDLYSYHIYLLKKWLLKHL